MLVSLTSWDGACLSHIVALSLLTTASLRDVIGRISNRWEECLSTVTSQLLSSTRFGISAPCLLIRF